MAVIPTLTATCPLCEAVLEIKNFDPDIDEPIECAACGEEVAWEFDDETNVLTLMELEEDDEDMDLDDDEESDILSDDIDREGEEEDE